MQSVPQLSNSILSLLYQCAIGNALQERFHALGLRYPCKNRVFEDAQMTSTVETPRTTACWHISRKKLTIV